MLQAEWGLRAEELPLVEEDRWEEVEREATLEQLRQEQAGEINQVELEFRERAAQLDQAEEMGKLALPSEAELGRVQTEYAR